jgi:hypothetical protein
MSLIGTFSMPLTSSSEEFPSGLHYDTIKQFLESDFDSTEQEDQLENSGTNTVSGKSETTQPTKNSSMSKYSPSHYQRGKIEVWDFIVDQGLDYLSGNCIKYICRAGHKSYESEMDDWLKIKAYVDRKIKAISESRN